MKNFKFYPSLEEQAKEYSMKHPTWGKVKLPEMTKEQAAECDKRVVDILSEVNDKMEEQMAVEKLLEDRQSTHGDFADNARIAQELKGILRAYGKGLDKYAHQEALDMICLKMSRIASGQAAFEDHWADIAGYAELGRKACATEGVHCVSNIGNPDDEASF